MYHSVDPVECAAKPVDIAHVAHCELRLGREVGGRTRGMDLGIQAVEDPNGVPRGEKAIDDERADEPRAARNEDDHAARGCTALVPGPATRTRFFALQSSRGSINRPPLRLSLVIPARDEAENIGPTLDALGERLGREGIDYELVVVDDGSSDATPDRVAERMAVDARVRLVRNAAEHGFGHAVRRGLDAFTGDAVVVVMADGSDSPDDVVRYFYVLRDRAECAFGSRFLPGSQVVGYPPVKLLLNRITNWCIRILFGLRYNDVTNAFKGYRANVIEGCRPFLSPHFNLTVEVPLKAIVRGYSYETLPISWRQRHHGVSSLKLKEMGSRYAFIVLHVWLEKMLTRGDYRRSDGGKPFRAIADEPDEAPPAVARMT